MAIKYDKDCGGIKPYISSTLKKAIKSNSKKMQKEKAEVKIK